MSPGAPGMTSQLRPLTKTFDFEFGGVILSMRGEREEGGTGASLPIGVFEVGVKVASVPQPPNNP